MTGIKKKLIIIIMLCLSSCICLAGCGKKNSDSDGDSKNGSSSGDKNGAILKSPDDVKLISDEEGVNYTFMYGDEEYRAIATQDNWKILNSYRITNHDDMVIICEALIQVMPIHGKDMVSYRTAEDMAYEWEQHNLAYLLLPEDSQWKEHVRDVDLNPEDQGKNLEQLYEDRTGKKFDLNDLSDH